MKAVNKFKALLDKGKSTPLTSILGDTADAHFSYPPTAISGATVTLPPKSHSFASFGKEDEHRKEQMESLDEELTDLRSRPIPTLSVDDMSTATETAGTSHVPSPPPALLSDTSTDSDDAMNRMDAAEGMDSLEPDNLPPFRSLRPPHAFTTDELGTRGHARDPLQEQLFLYIGPSTFAGTSSYNDEAGNFMPDGDTVPVVSESPGAADVDIYETAYRDEIERIMARAKEQNKEPNVYLTRRIDERLMAISGFAGKWAARSEEAKNQFKDYTQFSARKARVTEVSRALRQAAREEYEKRKQERRELIASGKLRRAEHKSGSRETQRTALSSQSTLSDIDSGAGLPPSPGGRSAVWKGKAVDKGRQAKTSFRGLVDNLTKNRSKSGDDES